LTKFVLRGAVNLLALVAVHCCAECKWSRCFPSDGACQSCC